MLNETFDTHVIVKRLEKELNQFSGTTVLLTGAAGFLGRYFLDVFEFLNDRWLAKPVTVYAFDRNPQTIREGSHIVPVLWDVTQPFAFSLDLVNYAIHAANPNAASLDLLIHAAGNASPAAYRSRPMETLDVCYLGTKTMLDLALKHGARFLYFSTSEIYGDPDPAHIPTNEDYNGNVSPWGPRACYDEGKRVGETLCWIYQQKGADTVRVRPFNVYGPGMGPTDQRVFPNFAAQLAKGQSMRIYGDGNQTRTACYITDAMVGFFLAIIKGKSGEVYNIGNDQPEISIRNLATRIAQVLNLNDKRYGEIVPHPPEYPQGEPDRRCPDISKAKAELGFQPQVDLDEGIRRFFSWALENYPKI